MRAREPGLQLLALLSVSLLLSALLVLLLFLLKQGSPALGQGLLFGTTGAYEALFEGKPVWDGIWPAVQGTLLLLFVTLCFALLPGIACGVFLACYATPGQRSWLGGAVELLAGIPSIVMGLFGFVLILFLRRLFLPEAAPGIFLASFCLALLVLPSLVIATRSSLQSLPADLYLTASALGITHNRIVWHLLLPAAGQGIFAGIFLALGRAAEDTAVIMLTGAVANSGTGGSLWAKFEALPFFIFYTAAQYSDTDELQRAFGAALVLLLLSSSLFLLAWYLQKLLDRRWKGEV